MGDVLEHIPKPDLAVSEACRVADKRVVMTVWEEWRLPSVGQHIEFARKEADEESRRLGYASAMAYQDNLRAEGNLLASYNDEKMPHLSHINRFDDREMMFFLGLGGVLGFRVHHFEKVIETIHQGHAATNWLICLERWR